MYMRMLLGMAAVFQMPAMVFFLARMGVVTARWMIAPIQVRRAGHRRHRRRHHAELRRRKPDDRGRSDGGPLHPQHRHRLAVREEEISIGRFVDWKIGRLLPEFAALYNLRISQSANLPIFHCFDHIFRFDFLNFLRPAIAQLHHSVLQSLRADRQPQRHAEQIGVLELHAGAQPFAIVVQHFESRALRDPLRSDSRPRRSPASPNRG